MCCVPLSLANIKKSDTRSPKGNRRITGFGGAVLLENYFAGLATEKVNPETESIDLCTTEEMLTLMNKLDSEVPAAVGKEIPQISKAVDILHEALSNGHHMVYLGAGTSGRLGVLDASECPPTFNTPPEMVQAYIAGGDIALRTAVEGCEDSREEGEKTVAEAGVSAGDVVIGITASGSAPYVLAAMEKAKSLGAKTIGVTTNANTRLANVCDVCIAPLVGPEAITGSTRLKSGTAQKMVLNMLTTCTMIKLGKVYSNFMVDLRPSNVKLHDRAQRIISGITGAQQNQVEEALEKSGGDTKLAIMLLETGLSPENAAEALEKSGGVLRRAIELANK